MANKTIDSGLQQLWLGKELPDKKEHTLVNFHLSATYFDQTNSHSKQISYPSYDKPFGGRVILGDSAI
ncbi:MAG: hypothetical protein ABIE92_08190 [bacterium]